MTWTGIPGSGPVGLDGGLTFLTDNAFNIGAATTSRPSAVYAATVFQVNDGANAKRLQLFFDGANPQLQAGGVPFFLRGDTSQQPVFAFYESGTERWRMTQGGHLLFSTDNAQDIGAAGANRPRTGYFATSLVLGATLLTLGPSNIAGTGANVISNWSDLQTSFVSPKDATSFDLVIRTGNGSGTFLNAITLVHGASIRVQLGDGTGDVQWMKALVALGAGGAATLGATGGSGPAATAQRGWLRIIESDGVASWYPVWR